MSVHHTTWIEIAEQFAADLLLDVKAHFENVLSSHRPLNVLAARLKADFGLGPAVVTLVLRITAAEEHAVIVKGKTLGAEEGDEVAVVPSRPGAPSMLQDRRRLC